LRPFANTSKLLDELLPKSKSASDPALRNMHPLKTPEERIQSGEIQLSSLFRLHLKIPERDFHSTL
jgi:hypothetical protein